MAITKLYCFCYHCTGRDKRTGIDSRQYELKKIHLKEIKEALNQKDGVKDESTDR